MSTFVESRLLMRKILRIDEPGQILSKHLRGILFSLDNRNFKESFKVKYFVKKRDLKILHCQFV